MLKNLKKQFRLLRLMENLPTIEEMGYKEELEPEERIW